MDKLSFYVVDNLRSMQDSGHSFKLTRVDTLDEAVKLYNSFPREYTSAIGGVLGRGEIDLVHRKNGDDVLVNDFRFIERWNTPVVDEAIEQLIADLRIRYESDVRTYGTTIVVPLQYGDARKLNSYFDDKYLLPDEDTTNLLSAVNEVYIEDRGWIDGYEFYKMLTNLNEYENPTRYKVQQFNVNYIDLDGRTGQADMLPCDFALIKEQTEKQSAKKRSIDEIIDDAQSVAMKSDGNQRQQLKQREEHQYEV